MKTPQLAEAKVRELLQHVLTEKTPCAILGVRGYYRDTMGQPGVQEAGIYDDAMFFVAPGVFRAVQANTDPSRVGWNASLGKPFAMLQPGVWHFIRGPHKGRVPALRQATEEEAAVYGVPGKGHFKVWRADNMRAVQTKTARTDEGYFAINIHRGGENTTSSWGCQTIPPETFGDFMADVWEHMVKHRQHSIPYLLVNGPVS